VGLRNPPADGPTNLSAAPYPVWCSGDDPGLGSGARRHGQGTGCIEMRYLGAYMGWCAQAFDPAWRAYYAAAA
jgi:hypothetical protein